MILVFIHQFLHLSVRSSLFVRELQGIILASQMGAVHAQVSLGIRILFSGTKRGFSLNTIQAAILAAIIITTARILNFGYCRSELIIAMLTKAATSGTQLYLWQLLQLRHKNYPNSEGTLWRWSVKDLLTLTLLMSILLSIVSNQRFPRNTASPSEFVIVAQYPVAVVILAVQSFVITCINIVWLSLARAGVLPWAISCLAIATLSAMVSVLSEILMLRAIAPSNRELYGDFEKLVNLTLYGATIFMSTVWFIALTSACGAIRARDIEGG